MRIFAKKCEKKRKSDPFLRKKGSKVTVFAKKISQNWHKFNALKNGKKRYVMKCRRLRRVLGYPFSSTANKKKGKKVFKKRGKRGFWPGF